MSVIVRKRGCQHFCLGLIFSGFVCQSSVVRWLIYSERKVAAAVGRMKEEGRRNGPAFFHQDNARPHTSTLTRRHVEEKTDAQLNSSISSVLLARPCAFRFPRVQFVQEIVKKRRGARNGVHPLMEKETRRQKDGRLEMNVIICLIRLFFKIIVQDWKKRHETQMQQPNIIRVYLIIEKFLVSF